jgi:cell division septation protein DedD
VAIIIFILIIGLVLAVGIPIVLKEWGLVQPTRSEPRANVRRSRLRRIGVPAAAAVAICLLAWAGLSLLFSPDSPERIETAENLPNSVSNRLDGQPGQTPAATPVPAAPSGERKKLVVETPLAKAAVTALPVASPLDRVGHGLSRGNVPTGSSASASVPEGPALPIATPDAPPTVSKPEAVPQPTPQPTPPPAPRAGTTPSPDRGSSGVSGVQFTVHLASFKEKANADRSLASLKSKGVPAFLTRIELDQTAWYRLMVGRFPTRGEAEAYGRELRQKGLLDNLGEYAVKPLIADTTG